MKASRVPYKGINARTFKSAIKQLLEREYKLVGSHKIIELIADDIDQLHDKYYSGSSSEIIGEIRWITVSDENERGALGKRVEEYETTVVKLPYLTREDIKLKQEGMSKREHDLIRLERLTKSAKEQGGLLSEAELATILNYSMSTISKRINTYQERNNEVLPLRGNVLDMGRGVTHKKMIIQLYEEGVSPPVISKRTYHSLEAVDRYVKDYERVKFLSEKGLSKGEIKRSIDRGKTVISEYIKLLNKYHPELQEKKKK